MDEAMVVHVSIDKLAIGTLDAVAPNMRLLRLALPTTVPANELVFSPRDLDPGIRVVEWQAASELRPAKEGRLKAPGWGKGDD